MFNSRKITRISGGLSSETEENNYEGTVDRQVTVSGKFWGRDLVSSVVVDLRR